ncbi:Thermolysin metallopeptidase, alpha-helical domain [Dyadobacter soli]|uniref:Thermolysin metallopeptidase, alpha-helical domain n=1 Tax=Dyadobacter soli TaxID=659014 RepID=A0A1G7NF89_9BACT|nr:M4 family metallopeptidase [Dyadobacter soli]SDF72765.1 Thermolysin metallopeptidase, alpha-helical domain [Dyadobacter soli]
MKKKLLLFFGCLICLLTVSPLLNAQPIYNQKNVTQDVLTNHYGNSVPTRVMEYSTDQAGTIIERRLEVLPESDLPAVRVRTINDLFEEIPFVNQPPFNGLFEDGLFGLTNCVEAATLLFGTEVALKVIKDKFGWIGLDNQAVNGKPIIWNIVATGKPSFIASPAYSPILKEFLFKSDGSEPENINHIDVVGHELVHGIIDLKIGAAITPDISPCSERRVLEEALGDIIGLYILNEYEQNSPAFYQWRHGKGLAVPGRSFDNPNSLGQPDTYYGDFYENICPIAGDFPVHKNATVIDHWYYLLAVGTTGTETNDLGYSYHLNGIGINKAIQIVWKCLDHLTPKTDFEDLKQITLKVTEQLYGLHSTEYLSVMDAWCAVGICENNLGPFYMSPAHGETGVEPWPGVNVNVVWEGLPVDEWEVQMATNAAFTEKVQTHLIKNFATILKPGGGSAYSGFATGYYLPGERVYARARITKAGPNFCKGYNPLCVLYQQYGPAHAFTLDDNDVKFWHAIPIDHWIVNPWNDPSISWKSVGNAEQYVYEVGEDEAFSKIVFTGTTPHSGNFSETGVINTTLGAGKTYFTRVRAKRFNTPYLINNYGAWSKTEAIQVSVPKTSILQALNQKPGDPATEVGNMGFWVGWYSYAGATHYIIQIATDDAFQNVIRTKTVAGNLTTELIELPSLPDSYLYVRVLPQNGPEFGICDKIWRVKTKAATATPLMKSPADGTSFPFNAFQETFEWKANSLNMNLVHHFELHFKKKPSNVVSIFSTPGISFSMTLKDPSLFTNKPGFEVAVLAVGPLGAKSALSSPFSYQICADHPEVLFPGDLTGVVDAQSDFNIQWKNSLFDPNTTYLVTLKDAMTGIPIPNFNNKPTAATSMLVPAGTLTNSKKFAVSVKNAASCAGILLTENVFSAISSGSNQPQPPKLVNFTVELTGFRKNVDAFSWATSDYVLGIELRDPDDNVLALVDPNGNQVTELLVDSENSGVIMQAFNKQQGQYTLRLKMKNIFNPLLYYPFDQPRFSVFLNGKPEVNPHVITANFLDPTSIFHEWEIGEQFQDIILNVK